jgi:hypothetical protein
MWRYHALSIDQECTGIHGNTQEYTGKPMSTELIFESRASHQVLRQDGAVESEPVIALELELMSGPNIYAAGAAIVNKAAWHMKIHRHPGAPTASGGPAGSIAYAAAEGKSRCTIAVHQSPGRYAALLDMFKGGYVSEITVMVAGLSDRPDYSKGWDTTAGTELAIEAICFEFPLPQSEA